MQDRERPDDRGPAPGARGASIANRVIDMTDFRAARRFRAPGLVESYWEALRAGRPAPARGELDPRGMEDALEYAFILERDAPRTSRLRIAGRHLCDLAGDEILLTEGGSNDRYDETWGVRPPFGPYPRELGDTYPLTAEVPARTDRAACEAAADGVARLVELHPEVAFTLVHDDWPETALARVPEGVRLRDLHARE